QFAEIRLRAICKIGEISRDLEKAHKVGRVPKFTFPSMGNRKKNSSLRLASQLALPNAMSSWPVRGKTTRHCPRRADNWRTFPGPTTRPMSSLHCRHCPGDADNLRAYPALFPVSELPGPRSRELPPR